jgi:hypothetical protein
MDGVPLWLTPTRPANQDCRQHCAKAGPSFVPKPPRATPQWCAAANFTRPLAAGSVGNVLQDGAASGTTMRRKAALRAMRRNGGREALALSRLWPEGRQY